MSMSTSILRRGVADEKSGRTALELGKERIVSAHGCVR
jgi:hypothetical protein